MTPMKSLFILQIALTAGLLRAEEPLFSIRDHLGLVDSAIQLAVNQRYDGLIPLLERKCAATPGQPLYPFYLMLAYEAMMIDYETTKFERKFDSLGAVSEAGFNRLMKNKGNRAWMDYFLGILYVTRGAHELRFANYLSFTKSIIQGVGHLKKSVKEDSTLVDAFLYLGAYKYVRAELTSWLPFADEEKEEAVGMIEAARLRSVLSREVSQQVLTGLYGHMGEVAKSESLAADFSRRYPENRAIHWLLANVYLSKKRYADAQREFLALKPLVTGIPAEYAYNYVSVDASLAQVAFHLGEYAQCAALCDTILAVRSEDGRIEKFRRFAKKYKAKAGKKQALSGRKL